MQFVVQYAEGVDCGGLGTEHERAKREGAATGVFGQAEFGGGEVAFGTDEEEDGESAGVMG